MSGIYFAEIIQAFGKEKQWRLSIFNTAIHYQGFCGIIQFYIDILFTGNKAISTIKKASFFISFYDQQN